MNRPKISVLMYTARADHPFEDRSWHCFDPVTRTLTTQTFDGDFELVVVDMHWERRQDWFKEHPQPFPVKHVPSSPNLWQDRKRTGLCAQINRGFVWADGELIWMCGENNMLSPRLLETAWAIHELGMLPTAWYGLCQLEAGDPHPDCPTEFDILGFTRRHVKEMDHRQRPFLADPGLQLSPCHHSNYFGYSGVTRDMADNVNGFDELMDGQWGLFDCDFGSRLDIAGCRMGLHRDLFVMEPPIHMTHSAYEGISHHEPFKCHYAILLHNRATARRVNTALPPDYPDRVKRLACFDQCGLKEKCAAGAPANLRLIEMESRPQQIGESAYYPFCEGQNRQIAYDLFADPPVRELRDEREKRHAGLPPYDRATFAGI